VTAIAAAAVAVAVILLTVFGLGGSPAGPTPAAAAVLNRLARLIAAQPLTPQPGQYLYVESRSEYPAFGGNCETLAVDHRQIWIGTDGSGLIRETTGPEHFSSAADQATCLQANPKMQLRSGGISNDWFAPQCLELGPTNDWSSLSSDPQALLQQMRQIDGGPSTPGEDFVHVGDFLRETDAPPAVRATLYQAAALIPGIQLLGTVRDHDGRPGLGIAYPSQGPYASNGSSSELIFDPRTGELLGEQGTGPEYWAVYLREKVVNGLPTKPPSPLTPPCVNSGGTVKQIPGGSITTGAGLNETPTPANP
jgi:RNA polymerase sigma-70 factor (ECF subfamily)